MADVLIAFGSNVGNRRESLRRGLRLLADRESRSDLTNVRASALYESAPVGVTDQPAFLNAVVQVQTALAPETLLGRLQAVEHAGGRRPGPRWGPRPLDLDILAYDDLVLDTERLTLPHPRIRERSFVLRPLADLVPDQVLPGWPHSVREALAAVDVSDLEQVEGPAWAGL